MKTYREFTREDFKELADVDFETQLDQLKRQRGKLEKIAIKQPNSKSKEALRNALRIYDDFIPYLDELRDENICSNDKWLFCFILDKLLLRIEEYYDKRDYKDALLENMFW